MALINRRCQIPGDESETDRHTATANLNRAELNSIPRNMQSKGVVIPDTYFGFDIGSHFQQ